MLEPKVRMKTDDFLTSDVPQLKDIQEVLKFQDLEGAYLSWKQKITFIA